MTMRFITGLINFFLGLVEVFLGLRVILRLFAANPDNGFVQFIYNSSNVLMQPFRGIFPVEHLGNGHIIDFSALFAMVIYALVALLFLAIVGWLRPNNEPVETETVVKKRR